jgi:hypothetical protein
VHAGHYTATALGCRFGPACRDLCAQRAGAAKAFQLLWLSGAAADVGCGQQCGAALNYYLPPRRRVVIGAAVMVTQLHCCCRSEEARRGEACESYGGEGSVGEGKATVRTFSVVACTV